VLVCVCVDTAGHHWRSGGRCVADGV